MKPYAEVAVPLPIRGTFHYRVPARLDEDAIPGKRVLVPFGPRKLVGYILGRSAELPEDIRPKAIMRIVDQDEPTFDSFMLDFLQWISRYYSAPIGDVLRAAHPSGTNVKSVPGVALGPHREEADFAAAMDPALKAVLLGLGETGEPLPTRELPGTPSAHLLKTWVEAGYLIRVPIETKARIQAKTALAYRSIESAASHPRGPGGRPLKRDEIHRWLQGRGTVTLSDIRDQFPQAANHLRTLVKEGVVITERVERLRDPFFGQDVERDTPFVLTDAQENAVNTVTEADGYAGFLLHGITGSGKTEVYLQMIERRCGNEECALVLVPEIALTPQLVQRFRARFGDEIAVLHSGLSDGQRYDQWRRIQRQDVRIIIGARSALFAPIRRHLSLIVVDEEHDASYKQGDGIRYHARDMALMLGYMRKVPVVLGSATPSLESIHNVDEGKLTLLELPERATGGQLPKVELVDLTKVGVPDDGERYLSRPVRQALSEALERGEQSIVFLNRRGHSSFVQCTDCGEVLECHQCAISLTWHKSRRLLNCHYCGTVKSMPQRCPACRKPKLERLGRGTEKVEERLKTLFRDARIDRLDRDTSRGRGLDAIVGRMRRRETDILIGTQMVTKGHDFPFVTLVCVLDADSGLHFPDFRASERTVQLLTQVSGRAGRAQRPGRVLIQSWDPSHFGLQNLVGHDYSEFCRQELPIRKMMGYPPYTHAAVVRVDGRNERQVRDTMGILGSQLALAQEGGIPIVVRGPAPAALEKIRGRTRWAMLLTSTMRKSLHEALAAMSIDDPDRPKDIRVVVDIDPHDLL